MKKTLLLFIFLTVTLFPQNPGDSVFAGMKVHTIKLQFNQTNYWDSLLYYYNQGLEHYMVATVTLNGLTLDSVGVRMKGNASFAHPNNKKPFKISFGEFNSNKWDGLKSVHLNNCWGDPTLIREKLHLDFCRDAGISAPRGNFAVLYINGVLWGLYSMEESVDKRFLANHYSNTGGNLYKAVDAIGASSTYVSDFLWYGADTMEYKNRYEFKTDESVTPWTDLMTLIDSLNNNSNYPTVLPAMFDLPVFYRAIAADNIMGNLDSYIGSGRNFYVYNNSDATDFTWIVWDAGLSFGAYPNSPSNIEQLSVTYLSAGAQRPLAAKLFENSSFQKSYLRELCRLNNTYFTSARMQAKVDSLAALVRPFVYADTKKQYTNLQFETNINSDVTPSGGKRIPGLKSFISARNNSLQSQLISLGTSCISNISVGNIVINEFLAQNDSIPDPAGEFEDWIELFNRTADTLDVSGMYLSDDYANPTKWTIPAGTYILPNSYLIIWADEDEGQAGLHAMFKLSASGEKIVLSNSDGLIIDSVTFGPQILNNSMARVPDGIGSFVQSSPTLGRTNGFTIVVPKGSLLVNEVMTENTTIPDPSNEYEAWIEIYNAGSSSIDLKGLYISNSFTTPFKWKFPATAIIPVNGYAVVWMDADSTQTGLHTNFTIPLANGNIMISNADGSVIDTLTYQSIGLNKSFSRIPNGSSTFQITSPTPGYKNSLTGGIAVGELVINEFCADNDSIPDPAGETDDWVELFNNSNRTIDLTGIYLSDNYTNATKWSFPSGSSIAPNQYLVVWADQDTGQIGYHAMFSLSASGERVIISNNDLTVIDSISYGIQVTNRSMARKPNAIGAFVQSSPTLGFNNDSLLAVDTDLRTNTYSLHQNYPNPFNPSTVIEFGTAQAGDVKIAIYNCLGEEVRVLADRHYQPGHYALSWNSLNNAGLQVPSGIYFYKISVNNFSQIKKMVLLR